MSCSMEPQLIMSCFMEPQLFICCSSKFATTHKCSPQVYVKVGIPSFTNLGAGTTRLRCASTPYYLFEYLPQIPDYLRETSSVYMYVGGMGG